MRCSSCLSQLLVLLGALKPDSLAVTELGRAMAAFPLAPRFAKMCVASAGQSCTPDAVAHTLRCRFGVVA